MQSVHPGQRKQFNVTLIQLILNNWLPRAGKLNCQSKCFWQNKYPETYKLDEMKILQCWRDELWDCMTSIIGPISATTIDGQGHHQGCVVRSVPYSKPQGQAFRGKQIQHQVHLPSLISLHIFVWSDIRSKSKEQLNERRAGLSQSKAIMRSSDWQRIVPPQLAKWSWSIKQ